jgi:Sugar phosphate isomerases/epimerases
MEDFMIHTALVSITFRKLSPKEIITLVAKAGLNGIEWGGDIHVPHGNIERAKEVYRMTADAGLKVAAYGSYYHVGCEEQDGISFGEVLDTALELKAPTIRVWAGNRSSREADEARWMKVVDDAYRISEISKGSGITISFEYHGNTLTDTGESALRLMKSVGRDNVASYWQPPVGLDFESQIKGLKQILPWLGNIHVFWWSLPVFKPIP